MIKIGLIRRLTAAAIAAGSVLGHAGSIHAVTFIPPGEGAPRRTTTGGSRSGGVCHQANVDDVGANAAVVPLLPAGYDSGMTLAERPEILVYVPATQAKQALFSLKEKGVNGKVTRYQTTVALSGNTEVLTIRLPESVEPLAVGETYTWYLSLQCDGGVRPVSPVIGKITRIAPPASAVSVAASEDRSTLLRAAEIYGAQGIWYDAVATLARLKHAQPADAAIEQHWQTLLSSAGLDQFADVSVSQPKE